MKKFLNSKFLIILFLIQPLVDIITSIMVERGMNVTVGMFAKIILLFFATLYLVFYDKKARKTNIIYFFFLFVFCILNLYNNIDVVKIKLVEYMSYLIKYIYFLILIRFFYRWISENKYFDTNYLGIPIVIIGISLILSLLTNTYFHSYTSWPYKLGISGWFSSGNAIGALLCVLFPISMYNAFYNKDNRKLSIILFIMIGLFLVLLGTKVGLLGYFLTFVFYLFYRIINVGKKKLDFPLKFIMVMFVISLILLPHFPAYKNIVNQYNTYTNNGSENAVNDIIFSDRDKYTQSYNNLSKKESKINKIKDAVIGRSYINNNHILIVERDFIDIKNMYGFYGLLLLFAPLLIVVLKIIKTIFINLKKVLSDERTVFCFISVMLTFAVAYISGHTLISPSASTFLSLVIAFLPISALRCIEKSSNISDKKDLLISSVHLEVGGIESTLVNLLNEIDYSKYNIDLLLLKPDGELYKLLPKEVNVITPFKSKLLRRIVLGNNKICKVIKHALFNKFTAFVWTYNKKYDVAISYSGYYAFIDRYVIRSYSNKKLIWVHSNLKYLYDNNKGYRNKFNSTKRKYKKFDKIVCVSNDVVNEVAQLLPQYKEKLCCQWNIVKLNKGFKEKPVKLKGDFKILSVGRICQEKRFDKLVDIEKNLLEQGYKTKMYIVGDGNLKPILEEKIKSNNLDEHIVLLGKRLDIIDIMRKSDLYLMTSDSEGLPTVLLESLFSKLPIVAPKVCGVKDIAENIAPKGSCIVTKNNISDLTNGVIDAINGKINKNFSFKIEEYNKKCIDNFYDLVGE